MHFAVITIKTDGPIGTVIFQGPFVSVFDSERESLVGGFAKAWKAVGVPVQPVNFYDPFHESLHPHDFNSNHSHLLHQTLTPIRAEMMERVCRGIPPNQDHLVFGSTGCTGLVEALEKNENAINRVTEKQLSEWALNVIQAFLANPIDMKTHDFVDAMKAFMFNVDSLTELCATPSRLSENGCFYFKRQASLSILLPFLLILASFMVAYLVSCKKRPSIFRPPVKQHVVGNSQKSQESLRPQR